MKPEAPYLRLQEDLKAYRALLSTAADTILDQDVSNYPIFVVHRHDLALGILLVAHDEPTPKWSVNVTTLEELATKRLVAMDKVDNFREVYKDPRAYFCIFVWNESDASFVFLPRAEDAD